MLGWQRLKKKTTTCQKRMSLSLPARHSVNGTANSTAGMHADPYTMK